MNKFSEQLSEIMRILLKAQSDGLCTVFFRISGHTSGLSIQIFYPEWQDEASPSYNIDLYLDEADNDKMNRTVLRIKKYLNSLSVFDLP